MQNGKSIEQLENVFLSPQYMKRSNTKIADSAKTKKKFKIYHIKKERNEFAPSLVNLSVICLYFGSNGQDTSVWCTIFLLALSCETHCLHVALVFLPLSSTQTHLMERAKRIGEKSSLSLLIKYLFACERTECWAFCWSSKIFFPLLGTILFFLHRNNCIMFDVSHTYKSLSLLCWD